MLYQEQNSVGQCFFECIRYTDFNMVPHMHKHPELIHVKEGTIVLEADSGPEKISAGRYALILPNRMHAYRSPVHSIVDICIFSEDYTTVFAKEIRGKQPERTEFSCRSAVNAFLESELFVTDRAPSHYIIKSALYAALDEYLSQVPLLLDKAEDEELIHKILRYVGEHYTENLTLADIADILGYERHYLSRCFHDRVRIHFSRFVNWYRVNMATDLLQHTDLPITTVAMRSGFQSIRSFNRVYLELTGYTPREAEKVTAHQ